MSGSHSHAFARPDFQKKKRPDHNSGRDGPSEALCAYELLRVASEDAAAANETEQTGCQKDQGTGSGTELGGVTAIEPWKLPMPP